MIRKAKRSSAANHDGSGPLGSVVGRRAFAIRGASADPYGSGEPSADIRIVLKASEPGSPACLGDRATFALSPATSAPTDPTTTSAISTSR